MCVWKVTEWISAESWCCQMSGGFLGDVIVYIRILYQYIHTYPCLAFSEVNKNQPGQQILTLGSTDVPPCCPTFCHCVMDWALWAQLVPPALTHLLIHTTAVGDGGVLDTVTGS